jgi:hypothetical protein
MLLMKEMEELDTIKTMIENCIAQADAHQMELEAILEQNGHRIRALNSALKIVNKFLNATTVYDPLNVLPGKHQYIELATEEIENA